MNKKEGKKCELLVKCMRADTDRKSPVHGKYTVHKSKSFQLRMEIAIVSLNRTFKG